MSIMENSFSSYGEANDNDLVMESLGRSPSTEVLRVIGGKTIAYSVEVYLREFQEPAVPALAKKPVLVNDFLTAAAPEVNLPPAA